MSFADVSQHITRKELEKHCRRCTRGADKTTLLIQALIDVLHSPSGCDTTGMRLFDHERIQSTWAVQQRHVGCIQDVAGYQLYRQTGTLTKGGIELPVYRCTRGSTSLESFHHHLVHFVPGTTASDLNFQAYLLEGIVRWNEDRDVAMVEGYAPLRSYDSKLRHALNEMSRKVLGRPLDANLRTPGKNTGELIRVEYLYEQTGNVFEPPALNVDTPEPDDEVEGDGDGDEGFVDVEDGTIVALLNDAWLSIAALPVRQRSSPLPSPVERLRRPSPSSARTLVYSPRPSSRSSSPIPATSTERRVAAVSLEPSSRSSSPIPASHAETGAADTVMPLSQNSSPTPAVSTVHVGPDGVRGYDKVRELARYLVDERNEFSLSQDHVEAIRVRWFAVNATDKRKVEYQPRFKDHLTQGRFKTSKKTTTTAGMESLWR